MERPAQRYFCNKCGYVGNVDLHSGCGYLAYHLAPFEQNYIDQLERELALLKASPASAPVAAPDYRIADRGFRWDAENRQHIPHLLIEFAPVPANDPNDSKGWKDRDSLAAMLAAAPTPPVSEDRKDAERYRWLCESQIIPSPSLWDSGIGFTANLKQLPNKGRIDKPLLDAAIDQAMQEGKT